MTLAILMAAGLGSHLVVAAATSGQAATRLEIRLAEREPADGLMPAVVPGSQQQIYLHRDSIVTGADVVEARAVAGAGTAPYSVAVTFSQEGAAKMAAATKAHLNRPMAILLDGQVVSAPTVRSPIGANAVVTGNFTAVEAAEIASSLTSR